MRITILLASLLLALLLAVWTTQSPKPRSLDAADTLFSASRAMVDVREIASAPHPLGSDEHVKVRAYLAQRLGQLGFVVSEQRGSLTMGAVRRLQRSGGTPDRANFEAVNLVAVRKGTDASLPPLMLMAHYDTVVGSPGAADATSGVAAILETARALEARNSNRRDLVVVFTDAEEIGLEGARLFFEEHPLASRIGFILNLEARGGGGRASMFETGRGDGQTIQAFAPVAHKADGGVTATSLAVFMYENMPNGTDFTHARERGMAGLNFAFIGRPAQYHSPESTPDNLDQGALQHIGSQTLEAADRLMRADTLPASSPNLVYSDIFGRLVVSHPKWAGWLLLGLSVAGIGFAAWRARRWTGLTIKQLGQGALDGLWFVCGGFILLQGLRLIAGPAGERASDPGAYYVLLRRIPWMETGAVLAITALAFLLLSGARARRRRYFGYGFAFITVVLAFTMGAEPLYLVPGGIAAVLSLWPGAAARTVWAAWLGLLSLVFVVACAAQAYAPEAALILTWPLLLGVLTAVVTSLICPSIHEQRALAAPAVATFIGGAWLMGLGHFVFLGIGISLPGALALMALLVLLFARPIVPKTSDHVLTGIAVVMLLTATGVTAAGHLAEPVSATRSSVP